MERKKTTDSLYLTVEQVRQAADSWLTAQSLPPRCRQEMYQKTAERILYYQRRNHRARECHTKRTLQKLREQNVNVDQLPSCIPDNP